jgi:large subunit ribosomal protein L25
MMDEITIVAEQRTALGKKTGALRRSGITPFHLYGPKMASESLQADTHEMVAALNEAGLTTPVTVKIGSDEHFVMVQHIQVHPITAKLLHVDMIAISRDQKVQASVPLHFEGEALPAREEGASVVEDHHEIELEALALNMPHLITIDVSVMDRPDSAIHARDIELPAGVTLAIDPDTVMVRIAHRRGSDIVGDGGGAAAAAPVAEAAAPAEEAASEDSSEKAGE